jgi:hypothetical protein
VPHLFPVPLKRPTTGLVAGVVLAAALAVLLVLTGGDTALAAAAPGSGSGGGADPLKNIVANITTAVIGGLTAAVACVVGWKLTHNIVRPSMGQLAAVLVLGSIASYFVLNHTEGIVLLKDTVARLTH